jgi:DNA/RNA-binding domain of Phe-tRNA-synthetase-like protein
MIFAVDPAVFDKAPNYQRVVVLAADGTIVGTTSDVANRLRTTAASVRHELATIDPLDLPVIAAWREAFRACGWSATKYRPSLEALLRRALRGDDLTSGNMLIDIGTTATLRHLVPVGVHVLDGLHAPIFQLAPAIGDETFVTFDGTNEVPDVGEIIYSNGKQVLTRRWAWRQGKVGSVAGPAKLIAINVDIIDASNIDIEQITTDVETSITTSGAKHLGTIVINRHTPSITIDFQESAKQINCAAADLCPPGTFDTA